MLKDVSAHLVSDTEHIAVCELLFAQANPGLSDFRTGSLLDMWFFHPYLRSHFLIREVWVSEGIGGVVDLSSFVDVSCEGKPPTLPYQGMFYVSLCRRASMLLKKST